jgi:hypothetical protein
MKHVGTNLEGRRICTLVIPVRKHDDGQLDISIFSTTEQNQDFVDS